MRSFILLSVFVASIPSLLLATEQHSGCYNYFLQKDQCVPSSKCHPCPKNVTVPPHKACSSGSVFQHPSHCPKGQHPLSLPKTVTKVRRYDTTEKSFFVAGGNGTCGMYNTTTDLGVCLWSGPASQSNASTVANSGWLNGAFPDNCNKKVWIHRQGQPDAVYYARVLDGCTFATDAPEVGCFQTYVTSALFNLLQPTQEESQSGAILNLSWDFLESKTDDPQVGPV